jgi:hypothetical protein
LVPVTAVFSYAVVDWIHEGDTLLATVEDGARQALFAAAAATTGALLGFAITGVTVLLTVGQGPRMAWLKSKELFRYEVRFLFFSAIVGLAISTVVFLVLIAVGSEKRLSLVCALLAIGATAIAVDRLWRLVGFLNKLMAVALKDADNKPLPNPPFTEPTDID